MSLTHTAPKSLTIRGLSKSFPLARRAHPRGGPRLRPVASRPASSSRCSGRRAAARRPCCACSPGSSAPDAGAILLDDRSIEALPAYQRRIGMVFQNYALFPHMTVVENVAYSLRIRKTDERRDAARGRSTRWRSSGLAGMGARLPGQLSGGQQQRVALARALVMEPDLLLFDEPLSNLDAKLRVQVRGELRRLQRQLGTTALYVTHDQDEAMSLSDRIAVMNEGRIEQLGTPEEVYATPASLFVAGFVGQVNVLPARVVERRGDVDGRLGAGAVGGGGRHVNGGANGGATRMARASGADSGASGSADSGHGVLAVIRPEAIRLTEAREGVVAGLAAGAAPALLATATATQQPESSRKSSIVATASSTAPASATLSSWPWSQCIVGGRAGQPARASSIEFPSGSVHILPASAPGKA